jgi:hypothetical protein
VKPFRTEKIVVFPSDKFSPSFQVGQALNAADMAGLRSGERRLYVYGHIRYEDVFGVVRNTKFRLMYGSAENLKIGRLVWADDGNEQD